MNLDLIKEILEELKVDKNFVSIQYSDGYLRRYDLNNYEKYVYLYTEQDGTNYKNKDIVNALIDDKLVNSNDFDNFKIDVNNGIKRYFYLYLNKKQDIRLDLWESSGGFDYKDVENLNKAEIKDFILKEIKTLDDYYEPFNGLGCDEMDNYKPTIKIENRTLFVN